VALGTMVRSISNRVLWEGHERGGDTHAAAIVGDTVGDPLKDTVGPSLDILIKIMSTISLIGVAIFSKFNLFSWLASFF